MQQRDDATRTSAGWRRSSPTATGDQWLALDRRNCGVRKRIVYGTLSTDWAPVAVTLLGARTQNSLPSGSASTTHRCSPSPTSFLCAATARGGPPPPAG